MYTVSIYMDYITLGLRMVYQQTANMEPERREALREPATRALVQAEEIEGDIIAARSAGKIQEANDHRHALEELARDMGVYVQHIEWTAGKEQ